MQKKTKPFFVLAPMDDVTDTVFRQIVHSCAPADLYFTEFVNVDGLMSVGRPNLLKKLQFTKEEGPLIAQLWGMIPKNYRAIAEQIAGGRLARELGVISGSNFGGIDINMGCPAKSEVKNGACSALIKNRPLAEEIINATKSGAGEMPVSVKTRVGFNEIDLSWVEFLLGFDLDMLTIHWRTRKEMSKVPAHWELAYEVMKMRDRISPRTKIVGNGDVLTGDQGVQLAEEYSLDGIMIGRGVFHDPYIFANNSPWSKKSKQDRIELFTKHVQLFAETWPPETKSRPIVTLNKFCKIYISGFDGAKELREQLMSANSTDELLDLLDEA